MTSPNPESLAAGRRSSLVDEAAHWLAVSSDPRATAEERVQFVAWLRRSNLHVEEFLRLSALTQRLSSGAHWPDDSVQELIAKARDSGDVARLPNESDSVAREPDTARPAQSTAADGFSRSSTQRLWLAAAALAAVAVGTAIYVAMPRPVTDDAQGEVYATQLGEIRSVILPDGSVVELNTRSQLRTRFSRNARLVELDQGEAIFKVAKDKARPFRVVAGDTEVVAVGTQFNVYAERARTTVTVLEGRVRVSDYAGSTGRMPTPVALEVASGEQVVVAPHRPIARVVLADPKRVTAWTERRLIFEEATLASVASQFARYSPRTIAIDDPVLARRQITGVFDASDPGSLVQFLGAQGDVQVRQTEEGWVLAPGATATK